MKLKVARIAAAGAVAALTACSAPAPGLLKADGVERVSVDSTAYAAELKAFRASALELGAALLSDGGDGTNGNVVSSPGSLLIALAMLRAGATGDTAAEMDGCWDSPTDRRDEAMNAVLASLEKFDGDPGAVDEENPPRKPVMHAANGLFVDKTVPTARSTWPPWPALWNRRVPSGLPGRALHEACHGCLGGGEHRWPDQGGSGEIRSGQHLQPAQCAVLRGRLECAFDPNDTSDLPFTLAGWRGNRAPAMNNELKMKYAEGKGWRAVDLPYAEGFVMRLVLPDAGRPAGHCVRRREADGNCGSLRHGAGGIRADPAAPVGSQSSFDLRRCLEPSDCTKL